MYQIMTFQPNGHPMSFENKKYSTREEVEARLNELKVIYDLPMSVREIKGSNNN